MHKPPEHLSREARTWWKRLSNDFELDDESARLLLQTALECFDEMRQAQALVERDGLLLPHGTSRKLHPASGVCKDARAHMLAALRALQLDVEPRGKPGRPAATR